MWDDILEWLFRRVFNVFGMYISQDARKLVVRRTGLKFVDGVQDEVIRGLRNDTKIRMVK
jgi:hypothetical protein